MSQTEPRRVRLVVFTTLEVTGYLIIMIASIYAHAYILVMDIPQHLAPHVSDFFVTLASLLGHDDPDQMRLALSPLRFVLLFVTQMSLVWLTIGLLATVRHHAKRIKAPRYTATELAGTVTLSPDFHDRFRR